MINTRRANLMKTRSFMELLFRCCPAVALLTLVTSAQAQGTMTFNSAALFSGTQYTESGMVFQVVLPHGGTPDDMAGSPAITGPSNIPYNSTPYMVWLRQDNPFNYVSLSLTNGSAFGLASVQLADPNSPSTSLLPITFLGFRADGSTVTNTFTTPGNNADHLLSYQFTSAFASGLTSVQIDATRWAMDNLAFTVPEPSSVSLGLLGLLAFFWRRRENHA